MAFDPFSWAIGFALSRTAGRVLDKAGAKTFASDLRREVSQWARRLPEELSDLVPDAIAARLFEGDAEELGPKRQQLQRCFEEGTIPEEQIWSEAISERRQEVYGELKDDAQRFFKADSAQVEPHMKKLAKTLHQQCVRNEGFFRPTVYAMLKELVERARDDKPKAAARPRPMGGLGVLSGVPQLPDKFVKRPEYLGPLKKKLLGAKGKAVAVTGAGKRKVGVQGMGGIGKTVLAAAAVREDDIRKAFPDGILWLTLGQQPNLIARQVQLARWLGDEKAAFQDSQQGRARLEELLRNLACLVVLDDVWDVHHATPFDVAGQQGRLLITTRFRNIVASVGAREQRLDVLEEDQAFALLAQWAGTTVDELPILSAHEVVKECGGLPLALAMIGAMIQRRPERWENAVERLRNADIDKIKHDFPDYPYPDLLRAIEVSIDGLDEAKDRYLDFAIFPEDTPIPEAVLQTLWQTDELDKHDVQDLIVLLEDRSMLRRDEKGRITLHDLQFDYVRKQTEETLADRHAKLIEAYRAQCKDAWHTVPDDGYFYQHSAYHFFKAGRQDKLRKLLFDYRFLRKKVEVTDPNEVLADYEFVADDPELRLVQSAIRLSIGALIKDASHLASQLCGRLMSEKAKQVQSLLDEGGKCQSAPWLRPMTPSLTPPGGPLVRILAGHTGPVEAVAVTPDGRYAVSGSQDKTLIVWDLTTGKRLRQLKGHADGVMAVAVTRDGRYAVSTSLDKTLIVWDLTNGKKLRQLNGRAGKVYAVAVTPDGRRAISGSQDEALIVWDLTTGKNLRRLKGHAGQVYAVAVTPDGRYAISGSQDQTLVVWDLTASKKLHQLKGHSNWVRAVAVTPDGRYAVSGSEDQTLRVWDLTTGKNLRRLKGHTSRVFAVAVTPDGRYAVSGSLDKTLIIWDLKTGKELRKMKGHYATPVYAVAVTPDGRYAVYVSQDKTLIVRDFSTGKKLRQLKGQADSVRSVAVTPDGRYAVSGSFDHTLMVWDLATGRVVASFYGDSGIHCCTVAPDAITIVAGERSGRIHFLRLENVD